jgi:anti-sigma factor RsiW
MLRGKLWPGGVLVRLGPQKAEGAAVCACAYAYARVASTGIRGLVKMPPRGASGAVGGEVASGVSRSLMNPGVPGLSEAQSGSAVVVRTVVVIMVEPRARRGQLVPNWGDRQAGASLGLLGCVAGIGVAVRA